MSAIAKAYERGFEARRRIFHEGQGEEGSITLFERNQTTGAIDLTVVTLDDSWYKRRTKTALGEFIEGFYVAESKLVTSEVDRVCLVKHGDKSFKVKLAAEPSGLQRYYVFEIQPV